MDENNNHINKKLGEQLPSHSPDPGNWQRISDKLDVFDAKSTYKEKLQGLPVHSPDQGTWNLIYGRLNRIAYYKTGFRIALSVAAGLLLFFTVSRITDQDQKLPNSEPQVAGQEKFIKPPTSSNQANASTLKDSETKKSNRNTGKNPSGYKMAIQKAGIKGSIPVNSNSEKGVTSVGVVANSTFKLESAPAVAVTEASHPESGKMLITNDAGNGTTVITDNSTGLATQSIQVQDSMSPAKEKEIQFAENEPKSILFQKEQNAVILPPLKSSVPIDLKPVSPKNHFALAMNYLPENIKNGTNTSLFHNVDLTASYNKEKVRFNTSLGMAYNEEQLQFNINYDINSLVTGYTAGGKLDTVSMSVADVVSQYTGNEKHQYFTYNLGLGRRLISSGKFSTWINLGAGFGLLLNKTPDLITTTANSVKSMYNAQRISVSSSTPVYNEVNVNFVTAIDFNYMILNRLSISFTPTSRWYLKPVLSLNNKATDNLTLGFKTGIKFDF